MYRIFSDKVTKTGQKVPYLSKNLINILSKTIGKGQSQISFYNIINILDDEFKVIVDLLENSNLQINIKSDNHFDVNIINDIIIKSVNPIIKSINNFIETFGYNINEFKSIQYNEIKVVNIDLFKSISQVKNSTFQNILTFLTLYLILLIMIIQILFV